MLYRRGSAPSRTFGQNDPEWQPGLALCGMVHLIDSNASFD
jgi:hypothetical protein